MEQVIIDFIKGFDLHTIISIIVIGWFFYQRQANRIDGLEEKIEDINLRLARMEGAFSSKDCCILKHEHVKKAE